MRIQDVAKRANVGVGTVSRVINESGYVSPETRQKVLRIIEEMNYMPNELARNLFHKSTHTIAVIVPDISNPFYATMVNEIEKELRKNGYKTLLCNTSGEKTNEQTYLDMLQRNMVDGILTGTHSLNSKLYEAINGPVVAFDTPILAEGIPVITVNHREGGRLAAQALLDAGCRHVVQFRDAVSKKFPYFERHEEFYRVMEENHVPCENFLTDWDQFDPNYYKKIVSECLKKYPDVDGFFGTDSIALYCAKWAQQEGKRIPQDVKIVAYDGTYILDSYYPTITSVVQPIDQLAQAGVNLLLSIINGEKPESMEIKLEVKLSHAMSTK